MGGGDVPHAEVGQIVKAIFGLVLLAALIAGAAWFLGFIEHSRTGLEHGCKRRVVDPMD
jgi:hypothetical protein